MTRRIVLAGGNGFIGRLLVKSFVAGNYEVVILTRSPVAGETAIRQVRWDGRTLGDWAGELEGPHALINLAGRSVNQASQALEDLGLTLKVDENRRVDPSAIEPYSPQSIWAHSAGAKESFKNASRRAGRTLRT